MYLLDTNVLGALIGKSPASNLVERVARARRRTLFTSSVNRAELIYGILHGKKGRPYLVRAERLWISVGVLAFDSFCAEVYAHLRCDLESSGKSLPYPDLMIAAVALENGLAVVTDDVRHFSQVPELTIENWLR